MSIGHRIRDLRMRKGLSQGDIERTTGMLRGYISRVEHGHTVPSLETLQRFAGALDVPLYRFFYTGEDEPAASGGKLTSTLEELAHSAGAEGSEARFLLQLKGLMRSLPDSDRTFLLNCARKLTSPSRLRKNTPESSDSERSESLS
jgi:transcriptional regulator with XRE-family HTH domain